jgi:hypothetical protein
VFAAWGRFVYRWRWATLVMSAALLGLSVVGLLAGGNLGIGNSARNGLEYARADDLISEQLSTGRPAGASFLLTFASKDLPAADPAFRSQVEAALAPIQHAPRVTGVHTPYDAPNPAHFSSSPGIGTSSRPAPVRVMRWRRPWPPRAGRSCSPASRSRSGSRRCSSTRAPKRILVL